MPSDTPTPAVPLLLTPAETAEAMRISPRTLWGLTARGEIPAIRIGRLVRYCPADLSAWIARQRGGDA